MVCISIWLLLKNLGIIQISPTLLQNIFWWSKRCYWIKGCVIWSVPFVFYVPGGFITSNFWFTQMQPLNKQLLNQDWHFSNVWSTAQREVVDMRWRFTGGNSSVCDVRQDITLNFQSSTLTSHSVLSEISKVSGRSSISTIIYFIFLISVYNIPSFLVGKSGM